MKEMLLVVLVVAGFFLLLKALLDALTEGAHLIFLFGLKLAQKVPDLGVANMHPLLVFLAL